MTTSSAPNFVADVAKRFNAGATAMQYEGEEEGTCGRIVCTRRHFHFLGGYDELSFPSGGQDVDLRERLKRVSGAHFIRENDPHLVDTAVRNTRAGDEAAEGLALSGCDPAVAHLRWSDMNTANCDRFFARRGGRARQQCGRPTTTAEAPA